MRAIYPRIGILIILGIMASTPAALKTKVSLTLPVAKTLCFFYKAKAKASVGLLDEWLPDVPEISRNCSLVQMTENGRPAKVSISHRNCPSGGKTTSESENTPSKDPKTYHPVPPRDARSSHEYNWRIFDGENVYYSIGCNISQVHRDEIETAIQELETKTCLRFKVIDNRWDSSRDFIAFRDAGQCLSVDIGRVGGAQEIQLLTCRTYWRVLDAIVRALGFFWEVNRPDRDEYIRINFSNIVEGSERVFDKYEDSKTYGTPYDYASLTHYEARSYAKDPNYDVITPIRDTGGVVIGINNHLSYWDSIEINRRHGCDSMGRYFQE